MNLSLARRFLLHWKIATWSKDPMVQRETPHRLEQVRNVIRAGLRPTRQWRGQMGGGGHRNRSQHKHVSRGASLYRDGQHWLAYGRSLRTGGWLP